MSTKPKNKRAAKRGLTEVKYNRIIQKHNPQIDRLAGVFAKVMAEDPSNIYIASKELLEFFKTFKTPEEREVALIAIFALGANWAQVQKEAKEEQKKEDDKMLKMIEEGKKNKA